MKAEKAENGKKRVTAEELEELKKFLRDEEERETMLRASLTEEVENDDDDDDDDDGLDDEDSDEDDGEEDCKCKEYLLKLHNSLTHPVHRGDTLEFIQGILNQAPIISSCSRDCKQNAMAHDINTKRNNINKTLKRERENDHLLLEVVSGYLHLENVTGNVTIHDGIKEFVSKQPSLKRQKLM